MYEKMLFTLAIAVSALSAFAVEVKVTSTVLNTFKNEFTTAKELQVLIITKQHLSIIICMWFLFILQKENYRDLHIIYVL